jgi:hypothetical protein
MLLIKLTRTKEPALNARRTHRGHEWVKREYKQQPYAIHLQGKGGQAADCAHHSGLANKLVQVLIKGGKVGGVPSPTKDICKGTCSDDQALPHCHPIRREQ